MSITAFPIATVAATASNVASTAVGSVSATNVQGAINQLAAMVSGLVFNVKDYGALGNGSTNDVAAINAAIVACNAAGGGTVFLPADIYAVGGSAITMLTGVTLVGAGMAGTVLKLNSPYAGSVITGTSGSYIGVSDLTVDVNNGITGLNAAIGFGSVDDSFIERVRINHMTSFGISWNGGSRFRINSNIIIRDAASGSQNQSIHLAASTQASDFYICDNICLNSGIEVCGRDGIIRNNNVSGVGFGYGITIDQSAFCHDLLISGNICVDGTGVDVNTTTVGGIEQWAPRCLVHGNYCYDNDGAGLLAGGQDCVYSSNVVYDNCQLNGDAGIAALDGNATYNAANSIFVGNRSYNTNGAAGSQDYGFRSGNLATGLKLIGNKFSTNATADTVNILADTLSGVESVGWAAWSPTVTATGGTITTVSAGDARWAKANKTVSFYLTIHITTNGTGSGKVRFTLPATPFAAGSAIGRKTSSGAACVAAISGSSTDCDIARYDGAYPGADGEFIAVSGSYESTA